MLQSKQVNCEKPEAWSSQLLANAGAFNLFTQRKGGISPPPFDTLNLGLTTRDKRENVLANRKRVEESYGLRLSALAWQVHGDEVLVIRKGDKIPEEPQLPKADAIVSNVPDLAISMFFADCVPLFFWDPIRRAGGLAHAGWRSTILGIAEKTVEALRTGFGSRPEDLLVAIGPSIAVCCFKVQSDVWKPFLEKFGEGVVAKENDQTYVNLWEANRLSLVKKGVKQEKIEIALKCTACMPDLYFSYRRDRNETGRMAGIIRL